jgi:hypothetical protein
MTFKRVSIITTFAVCLFTASTASAIPIADVGSLDLFVDSTNLANSGFATERDWIADALNVNVNTITYSQLASSGASAWEAVTGEPAGQNLYAFDFQAFGVSNPDFFLIKTGNLQVTTHDTFLYDNIANLRYGVIDLNQFGPDFVIEVGKISHVGTVGGGNPPPPSPVPEPASLLLFGSGLAAVAYSIRQRARRQTV